METRLSGRSGLPRLRVEGTPRLRSAVTALAAVAVGGLSFLLTKPPLPFPRCIFRAVTGWPCPSCGLTRAFIALGHGQLSEAVFLNIMSPILFVLVAAIFAGAAFEVLSGRLFLRALWERVKNQVLIAVLVLAAISWAWNIFKAVNHEMF